ncbi:MAG: multidrug transporter [Schumannella sp.]|nr:multidrug transporter [Schumannella sp.]
MAFVKAALFLILATLFWAGNFVFGAGALESVDPISLTWIRWAFALVPLGIVAQLIEKPDWRAAVRHLPLLALLGVLGVTGFSLLIYFALQFTSPLNASLINAVNPALIVVLAAVLPAVVQGGRREHLAWRSVLGIVLGLIGVVIVITDGDVLALLRNGLNVGDLLMLGAIAAWSIYTLVGRRIHDVPPITSTAIQVAIAVILLTPFLAINGLQWPSDGPGWGAIAYIVIFPSIAAYVLWNAATRKVAPATASIYINLQVVFTALIGLPFGFGITWVQVLGGLIVVAAVVLLARGTTKPVPAAPAPVAVP